MQSVNGDLATFSSTFLANSAAYVYSISTKSKQKLPGGHECLASSVNSKGLVVGHCYNPAMFRVVCPCALSFALWASFLIAFSSVFVAACAAMAERSACRATSALTLAVLVALEHQRQRSAALLACFHWFSLFDWVSLGFIRFVRFCLGFGVGQYQDLPIQIFSLPPTHVAAQLRVSPTVACTEQDLRAYQINNKGDVVGGCSPGITSESDFYQGFIFLADARPVWLENYSMVRAINQAGTVAVGNIGAKAAIWKFDTGAKKWISTTFSCPFNLTVNPACTFWSVSNRGDAVGYVYDTKGANILKEVAIVFNHTTNKVSALTDLLPQGHPFIRLWLGRGIDDKGRIWGGALFQSSATAPVQSHGFILVNPDDGGDGDDSKPNNGGRTVAVAVTIAVLTLAGLVGGAVWYYYRYSRRWRAGSYSRRRSGSRSGAAHHTEGPPDTPSSSVAYTSLSVNPGAGNPNAAAATHAHTGSSTSPTAGGVAMSGLAS